MQEYSAGLGKYGAFMARFEDGMAIGTGLVKVATAGAGLASAAGELAKNSDVVANAKEAKEILEWVEIGLSSTSGIVKGALSERDAIAVADGLNIALSKMFESVLPEGVSTIVNGSIETAIRSASAGKKFAEGDISGGLDELAKAITGGLGAVDKTEDKDLTKIGAAIGKGLTGLARSKDVAEKVKAGDYRGALGIVVQNLDSVVEEAKSPVLDWAKKIESYSSGIEESASEIDKQQQIINAVIDKEALDQQAEEAARLQRENFEEFMRQEDRAFEEALAYGFADPTSEEEEIEQAELKRLESIETLIAVQKRNQQMFELSKKIVQGGPALLGKLVPGMSLVAAATQLAYSIAEAIKHTQQLLIWMDNVSDAGKAATVQLDAMMNRYGLESRQTLQANLTVAIDAVRVAGEAMKLAGQAAPGWSGCGCLGGRRGLRDGGRRQGLRGCRDGARLAGLQEGPGEPAGPQAGPRCAAQQPDPGEVRHRLGRSGGRQPHRPGSHAPLRPERPDPGPGRDQRQQGRRLSRAGLQGGPGPAARRAAQRRLASGRCRAHLPKLDRLLPERHD